MILTTTETIPGKAIVDSYGVVSGSIIRQFSPLQDLRAVFRALVGGGEITVYTEAHQQARDEAIERMKQQAAQLGANAIVNVRFSMSLVASSTHEAFVSGTAVLAE